MRQRAPGQRGISLLEMLVALTILAISATVLFDWLYQVNLRMRALNENREQALAQLRAVEFLDTVNPAETPAGRQEFADFSLTWKSRAITPARPTLDSSDGMLNKHLAVYAVDVRLSRTGSTSAWVTFDTRLAGWSVPGGVDGGAVLGMVGVRQ